MCLLLKNKIIDEAVDHISQQRGNTESEKRLLTQSHKNALALFSQYLNKKNDSHLETSDFTEQTIGKFNVFLEKQVGIPSSTAFYIKERVRNIRDVFVLSSFKQDKSDISFSILLATLIRTNPKKIERSKLATKLGIRPVTLNRWFRGEYQPQAKNLCQVKKLEKYFKLNKDEFRKRLGLILFGEKHAIYENRERSPLGKKIRELTLVPYSLPRRNWPAKIEKEFTYIANFHLVNDIEDSIYREFYRNASQQWGTIKNPSGTYVLFQRIVEQFLGYLVLSSSSNKKLSGKGLSLEQLSVLQITDFALLKDFLLFYKNRVGIWSTPTKQILKRIRAMLNLENGLVAQDLHLGNVFMKKYQYNVQYKSWTEYCRENRKKIKQFQDSKNYESIMEPSFRVNELLDTGKQYDIIRNALINGKNDCFLQGIPINYAAVRLRNHLIFLFHILLGLRASHHSLLQIEKQLVRNKNGWHFVLYKEDLKNQHIQAQNKTTIELPEDVSELIDLYVIKYRPFLCSKNSKYLFAPSQYSTKNRKKYITSHQISRVVKQYSELYIESKYGLSSHDARRIIASTMHFIKCQEFYEKGSVVLGQTYRINQDHYTVTKIKTAFTFHFKILQDYKIIKCPNKEVELSKVKSLEVELYDKTQSINELKKEIESLRTIKKKNVLNVS